jgi:mono/diheme cytochrome c family protein
MRFPLFQIVSFAVAGFVAGARAFAEETNSFKFADVRALIETHCYKCHDAETAKGNLDLTPLKSQQDFERDPRQLEKLLRFVREREMPPPAKRPQPKEQERQLLVDWGQFTLAHIDYEKFPRDPGRVVIHRLSGAEYNNTMRDLLGVTNQPADKFPADGGGGGGFDNNADTLFVPPILLEKYLEAAGEVLDVAKPEKIFIERPGVFTRKTTAARKNIEHFTARAFRRPAEKTEVDSLMKLFERASGRGETYENSVKFALKGALVSPNFLFRIERDQPTSEPYRISDYELASRLSYFLWSSMPDAELFNLAAQNQLRVPAILDEQVKRMLRDPKVRAFADDFAGQWLRVRELRTTVQPDPGRFRRFTPELREAMYAEAIEFFASIIRDDASLLTLLDADYTFVNETLAQHYGMTNVTGAEFRRVALADKNRGGVLGMGAVLTLTSYPQRTSPVLRGKWVLEELLGAPPPPPPPDAGGLPAEDAPRNGLTFRQRLEEHRKKPQCAGCHSRLDPLGFGLENFDAIGRWRTEIRGERVDATGVMSTGETFSGPAELKQLLLQRKEEFIRNVAERMLAYALGRGMEYYDMPTIKKITERLKNDGYRSSTLITEIAKSYPFQYRRNIAQEKKP